MNAKEKMIEALYKLLAVKDFVDINVSEVCQIAKIHRTTFYAYYSNLLELLEDAKNQAIKEFEEENKHEDKDRNDPRTHATRYERNNRTPPRGPLLRKARICHAR